MMESSSWQGTPGKKMLGLKVVNNYGEPITFWRAMGRNAGKFVSAIIIYVGFLMPLWTKKKQALHDLMSDCLVVESNHEAADYRV